MHIKPYHLNTLFTHFYAWLLKRKGYWMIAIGLNSCATQVLQATRGRNCASRCLFDTCSLVGGCVDLRRLHGWDQACWCTLVPLDE